MPQDRAILIVEDEPSIIDVLRLALRHEGFSNVVSAGSGADALSAARRDRPSLVVLDIGLPDMSGLDVAVQLRDAVPSVPLLFLTARDSDGDKLAGFKMGADDYVTKPFSPLEVAARIKALLRRADPASQPAQEYDFGRFVLYPDEARLIVEGREVPVPARELRILSFLARNEGRVFAAEEIYRQVWEAEPLGPSDQNTVSVHVRRLRERIEPDPASPVQLVTIRGLGYKLVRESSA